MNSDIPAFLDYLKYQKRFSPHTIESYSNDLIQFAGYLLEQYELKEIRETQTTFIRSWLARLYEEERTPRTINRKLSTLKSFFKYLLQEGILSKNPASAVRVLKTNTRLPTYIEKKDMGTLLGDVDFGTGFKGRTDYLVFQLLYNTGIRLSELVNLKESQVDPHNGTLRVLGKGNKERVIPINQDLVLDVKAYQSFKRKELEKPDTNYLLVTESGRRLYPKYVYRVVNSYLSMVTSTSKKSPHVLRHSFATHLVNNGADLNAIKELLGHSSLAATQVYTHNTIEQLKDIHKRAHPKS